MKKNLSNLYKLKELMNDRILMQIQIHTIMGWLELINVP